MLRLNTRTKLILSAVSFSAVMLIAAVAQRNHKSYDPAAAAARIAPEESSRPRAVFGESPAPQAQPATSEPKRVEPVPAGKNDVPGDIAGFLERWRTSLARGDLEAHVATYAPRLERFFRQGKVTRDRVRAEKERLLRIYPDVNRLDITDIRVESRQGNRAVVTFRKDWDMSGARRFAGSERQRLTLVRVGDAWQIAGEEELKVYWVRR